MYATGSTSISPQRVTMNWCPPNQRKRPIDVVLMSIGGNDVGFGGLVAYAHDRERGRLRADRGLDRLVDPLQPAGVARLSRTCSTSA